MDMTYEVQLFPAAVDFILSQNEKMQAKIQRAIGLLETFGRDLH